MFVRLIFLLSHDYLVFGRKSSCSRLWYFCVAARASSSLALKHFWGLTCYLMKAPHHYLTLAKFGRCPKLSHRNEWRSLYRSLDYGCTDTMYVSKLLNKLPSYTTRGKLRECIAIEKFESTYRTSNRLSVLPLSHDAPCPSDFLNFALMNVVIPVFNYI